MEERRRWIGSARPFQPPDGLFNARLDQMRLSDPKIPNGEIWIPRAKADGVLLRWDNLVERSHENLAPANVRKCCDPVAIECKHSLVLADGILMASLHAQRLPLCVMCHCAARRRGDSLRREGLRALDIGTGSKRSKVEHPVH